MSSSIKDMVTVSRLSRDAREIQYNTAAVKQDYESDDPELEKYNHDKEFQYTYKRGTWWFKNCQKRINDLLIAAYEGKKEDGIIKIEIPTKRIAIINNFTIVA